MKRVTLVMLCASPLVVPLGSAEPDNRRDVRFAEETALEEGVRPFNEIAERDPIGAKQPELMADEVIAAIRGWVPKQNPVEPEVLKLFQTVAEAGKLPPGAELQFMTGWTGYNGFDFEVWWVDLMLPIKGQGATQEPPPIDGGNGGDIYNFRIRDLKIRSRPHAVLQT